MNKTNPFVVLSLLFVTAFVMYYFFVLVPDARRFVAESNEEECLENPFQSFCTGVDTILSCEAPKWYVGDLYCKEEDYWNNLGELFDNTEFENLSSKYTKIERFLTLKNDDRVYIEFDVKPNIGAYANDTGSGKPIGWEDKRDGSSGRVDSLPFIRKYQKNRYEITTKEEFENQIKILKLIIGEKKSFLKDSSNKDKQEAEERLSIALRKGEID